MSGRRAVSLVASASILAVAAVGVFVLASGRPTADEVSAVAAVWALTIAVFTWLSAVGQRMRSSTPQQLDAAALWLRGAITQRLREDTAFAALRVPHPLPVRWQASDGTCGASSNGELESRLVGHQPLRVVLAGDAGSGKTTVAARLADTLLKLPNGSPTPVLVSLADWDPVSTELDDWIGTRIAAEYPRLTSRDEYGGDAPRGLAHSIRVLPILDGLDELPDELRAQASARLLERPAVEPLVVCCRTDEWAELRRHSNPVPGAVEIQLEPLTAGDVLSFLASASEQAPREQEAWATVSRSVAAEPSGDLARALSTPLMASLLWTAYLKRSEPPPPFLTQHGAEAARIERDLLAAYLGATLPDESARRIARLLRFLARREVRSIAWWLIPGLAPSPYRRAFNALIGAAVVAAIIVEPDWPEVVAVAVLAGLFPRLAPRSADYTRAIEVGWFTTTRDRLRRSVAVGVAVCASRLLAEGGGLLTDVGVGVLAALGMELLQWIGGGLAKSMRLRPGDESPDAPPPVIGVSTNWHRLPIVLVLAALFGLSIAGGAGIGPGLLATAAFALALSHVVWFGRVPSRVRVRTQRSSFRSNLRYSALRGALIAAVAPALAIAFALDPESEQSDTLEPEVLMPAAARSVVLAVVLSVALGPAGQFLIAVAYLALAHRLPWRPLKALETACDAGLLRRGGLGYAFRHERLRESLAEAEPRARHVLFRPRRPSRRLRPPLS